MTRRRIVSLALVALALTAALVTLCRNFADSQENDEREDKSNARSLRNSNATDEVEGQTCLVWDPTPSECYDMASPAFSVSNETNSTFFDELEKNHLLWDHFIGNEISLEELEYQLELDPWYRHEYRALMLYTAQKAYVNGVRAATLLNKELRNRENVTMPTFARVLASGLNRVDPFFAFTSEDPLYRGVILPQTDDSIEKQWLSGASVVQEPTFFSASRSYTQALCVVELGRPTKDVVLYQFIIQYAHPNATFNETLSSFLGSGAADLEPFTFQKEQFETLFPPGTLFRVSKFERRMHNEQPMVDIFIIPLKSDNWVEDVQGHWSPIKDDPEDLQLATTLREETESTYRETLEYFGNMLEASDCYFIRASTDGEDNKFVVIGAVLGVAALLAVVLGFLIWYKFVRRPSDVTVTAVSINRPRTTLRPLASGSATRVDKFAPPGPPMALSPVASAPPPDQLPADLPGLDFGPSAASLDKQAAASPRRPAAASRGSVAPAAAVRTAFAAGDDVAPSPRGKYVGDDNAHDNHARDNAQDSEDSADDVPASKTSPPAEPQPTPDDAL